VPTTECLVCMDNAPAALVLSCSAGADVHPVCKPCVYGYLYAGMFDENKARRACVVASDGCAGSYGEPTLAAVLGPYYKAFARLEARDVLAGFAAASSSRVFTFFCGNTAVMLDPDASMPGDVFACTACANVVCLLCGQRDHRPRKCGDDGVAERVALEEAMTAIVVCACTCGRTFVKEAGCNKMTCACGKYMCNACKTTIGGYQHFCSCGSRDACARCHLYSDVRAEEFARVRALEKELERAE